MSQKKNLTPYYNLNLIIRGDFESILEKLDINFRQIHSKKTRKPKNRQVILVSTEATHNIMVGVFYSNVLLYCMQKKEHLVPCQHTKSCSVKEISP